MSAVRSLSTPLLFTVHDFSRQGIVEGTTKKKQEIHAVHAVLAFRARVQIVIVPVGPRTGGAS